MNFEAYKPRLKELIAYYYQMPDKGAGGYLHIVLDDGNVDFSSIQFCQNECEEHGDTFGRFLCDILLQFTKKELEEMYKDGWWGMR